MHKMIAESIDCALKNSSIGKKHKEHHNIEDSSNEMESNLLLSEFHDAEDSYDVESMQEE